MQDSPALELPDRQIVRALQIDPRVSFASMATVLGLSEATVSRRYARMRRTGMLRVTGVRNPGALGQSRYLVRLRCRPGSAGAIAESLALRDDVSWVALGAGAVEVVCMVRSRTREQREDLLGRRLPRAAAVLDLTASVVLRQFTGGRAEYWSALDGELTRDQEEALGSAARPFEEVPVVGDRPVELADHDDRIVSALLLDGRASVADLAAASGLTPGRATRRLAAVLADRVVHLHVELAPEALGFRTRAHLFLRVRPADTTDVGRSLALMPGVGFAAAMSGRDNVHALVNCRDLDDLYELASDRVGAMPGVGAVDVGVVARQVKQAGSLVTDGRLEGG